MGTATAPVSFLLAQEDDEPSVAEYEAIFKVNKKQANLRMVEKFAKILETDARILQVDGFDSEVLNVTPLSPNQLRVQANKPGVSSMLIVDENKNIYNLDIFVMGDVRHLQAYIEQLFPYSSVEAVAIEDSVVLRGFVAQPEHITEISDIAEQFYGRVLNQMKVGGVQQVMMRVKVMEVQRTKMRKFGFNFTRVNSGGDTLSVTPGAVGADPTIMFNIISSNGASFLGLLEALKDEGMLEIKAEPILVTTNGRPASLLNGGEVPVIVPQSLGTVSIEYKDYGVTLQAVPIILGNGRLRLELEPSVSEIDQANSTVTDTGVNVPAFVTRKVNTQVEMKFGQSLMIAGLISKQNRALATKIPLFGEIPWIGALFSYKEFEEVESELIVMVTPEYVGPLDASEVSPIELGDVSDAPTDRELFFDNMIEVPNYGGPYFDLYSSPTGEYCPKYPEMHESSGTLQPGPADSQLIPPPAPGNGIPLAPPESASWWNRKQQTPQKTTVASESDFWNQGSRQSNDWTQVEYNSEQGVRKGQGWTSRSTEGLLRP
ncbi:MAG TPA: pilus assembly protein N-terminal domain-containing protein [Planctomycetaceae bacterium]|nr:pilus assembly protein N-terminal domain-containing protein [Planctomycetaceae bacterium]